MARIVVTLVCLGFSLISCTGLRAAAARPKVVIAHAAMNFRVTPLWVAKTKASSPNTASTRRSSKCAAGRRCFPACCRATSKSAGTATGIIAPIAEGADFVIVAVSTTGLPTILSSDPASSGRKICAANASVSRASAAAVGWALCLVWNHWDWNRGATISVFWSSAIPPFAVKRSKADRLTPRLSTAPLAARRKPKASSRWSIFLKSNIPIMNHLMAVKKSYLHRQPEIVENVLRGLVEGLAFTWSPKSKSAVLKSVMRRLRITETGSSRRGLPGITDARRPGKKTVSFLGRNA